MYRDAEHDRLKEILPDTRINRTQWHSDVVCSLSFLYQGGSSNERRSPMRNSLRGLHSSSFLIRYACLLSGTISSGGTQLICLQPEVGGDTLFASQVEAYKRLSPEFQKRLEGLRTVHSAHEQAEASRRRGGPVRREPIETEVRGCSSSLSR